MICITPSARPVGLGYRLQKRGVASRTIDYRNTARRIDPVLALCLNRGHVARAHRHRLGIVELRAYLLSRRARFLRDRSGDGISTCGRGLSGALSASSGAGFSPTPLCRSSPRVWSAAAMAGARRLMSPVLPARDVAAQPDAGRAGGKEVHLAPGLSYEDEAGQPDVMRGEEVEIFGIAGSGARLLCCQARIRNGRGSMASASCVQDLCHRRTVRRAARPHASPAPSPGRRRRSRRAPPSRWGRRGAAAARGETSPACLASCSAHAPAARWASSPRRTRAIISRPPYRGGNRRGAAALSGRNAACRGRGGAGRALSRGLRGARGCRSRRAAARCGARAFSLARDGGLL